MALCLCGLSLLYLQALSPTIVSATGFGAGGCGGSGGGGTAGIGATLGCGLPPPAAPTPQDDGPGVLGASAGPPLGSSCIPTQQVPLGVVDPTTGTASRDYVTLAPSVTGNPETGLTASATIQSPLPIGSPSGPTSVAVPAEPVKTAAEQNADLNAAAQGIADELNAYQAQQIAAASDSAFDNPSAVIETLLKTPQYSATSFYEPIGPPVAGAKATSEDATTWTMLETVYVEVGRVVHDKLGTNAVGLPVYGPEYCSELKVAATDPLRLDTQVGTAVPAFDAQVNQIADALWHSFRRGGIVSEPANGAPTYVGVPTCVGLDTGLPTGSRTPNPFTLTLPLSLQGVAGQLPVAVSGRVAVSIVADGVQWAFHDPSGDITVHGQGSADSPPPNGTPTYDAASGTWPDADAKCTVYHQYRGLAAAPGVTITATEHFHIEVSGVYSTGSAIPVTFAYAYEPPDSPVEWSTGPYPVYQIEAVPFEPST
jgi:hypothetical protein